MKIYYMYIILTLIMSCSIKNSNPILTESNQPPDFNAVKESHIIEARNTVENRVSAMIEDYKSIPNEARTFENTLAALDDIYDQLYNIRWPLELIGAVHPDDSIRQTAARELDLLVLLIQQLKQDKEIYQAVEAYSQTDEARELTGPKQKFLQDFLLDFKRNGLELQNDDAELFQKLMAEAYQTGMLFFRNAQSACDTLWISEEQLAGLTDEFKTSHQKSDGRFYIDLPGPSFEEVMQNAEDEMIRKQVYYKRENLAFDVNQPVLTKLLSARQRLARLLGYKNYTEYALETRMAKTSENVINLENRLSVKMLNIARRRQQEFLQLKREHLNNPGLTVINPWDIQYYNRLYEEKYTAVNQDSIRCYFETNLALEGLLGIAEKLFSIKFQEIKNPSVWHPDVRTFKITDSGNTVGIIYFDLFIRKGKTNQGAAALPIRDLKVIKNDIRHPIIAIACNFSPPTDKGPSLLLPADLEYLFHEFGHAMHHLLGENDLVMQNGFFIENDFLEMPSQIWENWVWDEDAISSYARHYKTGRKIPENIVKKIAAARQRTIFSYQYRLFRQNVIDRIIHTDYDPDGSFDFEAMHKEVWKKTMPYVYPDSIFTETRMFPIGFSEYASCFYGFLWADIYAKDMFSVFKKQGVFNPEIGAKYRECILAPGASKRAIELADCFLGRSVDESAFLDAFGLVDQ